MKNNINSKKLNADEDKSANYSNSNVSDNLKIYAKPHIFGWSLLMLSGIFAIIVIFTLTTLWTKLDEFEQSSPENAINKFIDILYTDTSPNAMKLANVPETEFFTELDYQKYMQESLGMNREKILIVPIQVGDNSSKFQLISNENGHINLSLTKVDGKYVIHQDKIELKSLKIQAPEYIKILADGITIGEKYKISDVSPINSFLTLNDKSKIPKQVTYEIKGFFKEPDIKIDGIDAANATIERSDDVIKIKTLANSTDKINIETIAKDASKAYVSFINDDKKFDFFGKYLDKSTSYYNRIKTFDNSWATVHTGIDLEKIEFLDTISYSPEHFVTTIKFDCIIRNNKKSRTYPIKYTISFLKENNTYKIVNLE